MRYLVNHTTRYLYSEPVTASYGEHHLLARDTPWQHVRSIALEVTPTPDEQRERHDLYGNHVGYFALRTPHSRLEVTARSLVDVRAPGLPAEDRPWEDVRDVLRRATDDAGVTARALTLGSPQVQPSEELRELAAGSFTPGRGVVEAFTDLVRTIHDDFEFDPAATTVTTPVDEVMAKRAGVCQDFAHLLLGALRTLGLGARYVSGYLETEPPPGMPRLQGADASHAWAAVYVPGHGWVDGDPTNDQLVGERHVTVAWGRDYGDVAPLKGVIFTDGPTDELVVEVDVLRVDPETDLPYEQPLVGGTAAPATVSQGQTQQAGSGPSQQQTQGTTTATAPPPEG
jgi:transglutaminase-like putative cysteine protease